MPLDAGRANTLYNIAELGGLRNIYASVNIGEFNIVGRILPGFRNSGLCNAECVTRPVVMSRIREGDEGQAWSPCLHKEVVVQRFRAEGVLTSDQMTPC